MTRIKEFLIMNYETIVAGGIGGAVTAIIFGVIAKSV